MKGVDLDWEYPGGNGDDYKKITNFEKKWEIEAYPLLLGEIRSALGHKKLITAAVPGLEEDMIAFTQGTVPRIMRHLDFLNVMTYDLMNRRSNVTKHHSSIRGSQKALAAYSHRGVAPKKLNLGLGFYVKWVRTDKEHCANALTPIGCKVLPLEHPETGAALGNDGAFSWHDQVPEELRTSFQKASEGFKYDKDEGATYFYDKDEGIWWTYDHGNNGDIAHKVKSVFWGQFGREMGGVFAWGLGEDAPSFQRLQNLQDAVKRGVPEGPYCGVEPVSPRLPKQDILLGGPGNVCDECTIGFYEKQTISCPCDGCST